MIWQILHRWLETSGKWVEVDAGQLRWVDGEGM